MGWFENKPQAKPLITESKYTIDKVAALCDQIGPMRLDVDDVALKNVISTIAWGTLPYLSATSNGKPGAAQISETITRLEMLIQTLQGYIKLQNSSQDDASDMLERGYLALETYAQKISTPAVGTGVDKVTFEALTDYLTGNQSL